MRRRYSFIALVCLASGIFAFLLFRSHPSNRRYGPRNPLSSLPVGSPTSDVSPSPTNSPPADVVVEASKKLKEERITAVFLTPIVIFGKVIDNERHAVPGARVEIAINDSPNRSASDYTETTRDDGSFSIGNVHGISFSVRASKDGYYTTKESTAYRNVVVPSKGDSPMPTEHNPLVLILRRREHPAKLVVLNSRQIDMGLNGQTVTIDLVTGRTDSGQLYMTSRLGDTGSSRFDWSYDLSIPGGGVMEWHGEFDFEAPAEGYVESQHIAMSADQPNWSSDVMKDFFAKFSDGRFARFSITFYPGKRNFIVFQSYVNPVVGDRNLEFDPQAAATK